MLALYFRVLKAVETYAKKADLEGENSTRTVQAKVALEIIDLSDAQAATNVGFGKSGARGKTLNESSIFSYAGSGVQAPAEGVGSAIVIPEEAIAKANKMSSKFK